MVLIGGDCMISKGGCH